MAHPRTAAARRAEPEVDEPPPVAPVDAAAGPRVGAGRARLVQAVRLLVSGALLVFLVTRIDPVHLVPPHATLGTVAFLAGALALMAASFVVAAWRWQKVLAVFDVHVPVRRLLAHVLAGQFFGNVLPSTIGGDVLRVSRATRDAGTREVTFASVVIERLTGFVALPLLAFVGLVARPQLVSSATGWIAPVIAGGTVVALVAILFLASHPRVAGRFTDHENWMRYIGVIHVGVDRLRRDLRDALAAVGASVAYQVTVVASVFCAVHTIGVDVPTAAVLAFVPVVAIAQVAPISVSGLGVREGLLALLLHPLGVPTGRAVAVGLLWYATTLAVSVAGAPAFAFGHRNGPRLARPVATPDPQASPELP